MREHFGEIAHGHGLYLAAAHELGQQQHGQPGQIQEQLAAGAARAKDDAGAHDDGIEQRCLPSASRCSSAARLVRAYWVPLCPAPSAET
jgi:hypothetical protein